MPSYKAPVDDVLFLLNDVFHIERYGNVPGFAEASPDMVAAILAEGGKLCEQTLAPLNRVGDVEGCTRNADGSVTTPKGFKEAYRALAEGGWIGLSAEAEYGGQGLPHTLSAVMNEFFNSANMAFAMYPGLSQGRLCRSASARNRGTAKDLSAEARLRRVVGHDEPHGAALRHRPRHDPHQGRKAIRRKLQDHRHQDFHLRRRARSHLQYRASCSRAHRGCAGGHEGYFAFRGAEISAEAGWHRRRAERCRLRLHRGEDGDSRQLDLRNELRQCHWLAGRRREPRPSGHVHDDERGASRRRHPGPVAFGSRVPERGDLREGAAARTLADRAKIS